MFAFKAAAITREIPSFSFPAYYTRPLFQYFLRALRKNKFQSQFYALLYTLFCSTYIQCNFSTTFCVNVPVTTKFHFVHGGKMTLFLQFIKETSNTFNSISLRRNYGDVNKIHSSA